MRQQRADAKAVTAAAAAAAASIGETVRNQDRKIDNLSIWECKQRYLLLQ